MSVTFNTKASAQVTTGSGAATTVSNTCNISALNHTIALAYVNFSAAVTSPSVTYGGNAMTLVASGGLTADNHAIFCLPNPPTGSQTVTASWTGGAWGTIDVAAFDGADQTGGTTSCPNGTSATGGSNTVTSVTVTGAVGDMVTAMHGTTAGSLSSESGTLINTSAIINNLATTYDSGAASVTSTTTWTVAGFPSVVGVDIKAFGGGGTRTPTLTLMGVG